MFVKIVIVLLLLIVAASLLVGQRQGKHGQPVPSRLRPLMTKMALILVVLGAGIATFHFVGGGTTPPTPSTFHATEVKDAPYGQLAALDGLVDHTGRRRVSADFSGQVIVVFFGYTQCPDICPTALATMKEAMQLLGPDAERVQVLFVTVDPERDTSAVLAGYVPWFDARFLGLRGEPAATHDIAREFRVYYNKVEGKSALGYSIDHTATSYAYDPAGRLRLLIRQGETPAHIAADLKQLLSDK